MGRSSYQKLRNENHGLDSSKLLLQRVIKGFTAERMVNIIVRQNVPKEIVCNGVSRGVRHHATFVVDTTALAADIVNYGDDNGRLGTPN